MGGRRSAKTQLPEELIGKILAMLPFPQIFKGRILSRSWLERFSPVASLAEEVKKGRAILFQREVCRWSHKWQGYFPACFDKRLSLPFDFAWGHFQPRLSGLPTLSFLPEKLLTTSNPEMEGPLLYRCDGFNYMIVYVANILTRSWKQLPRRPQAVGDCKFYGKKLVLHKSLQTYNVVVFGGNGRDLRVQMYDSMSQVWTSQKFLLSKNLRMLSLLVYLDGVLYMVAFHDRASLLAFNVKERTLESLKFLSADKLILTDVDLLVYDGDLLIVVSNGFYPGGLRLVKLDTVTEQLVEVARGPPTFLSSRC